MKQLDLQISLEGHQKIKNLKLKSQRCGVQVGGKRRSRRKSKKSRCKSKKCKYHDEENQIYFHILKPHHPISSFSQNHI